MPVGPPGSLTSTGATRPTRAGAPTCMCVEAKCVVRRAAAWRGTAGRPPRRSHPPPKPRIAWPHLVLLDLGLDVVQVAVGEDDADIADQLVEDAGPLVVARRLAVEADAALHHRVLAHQDDGAGAQGLRRRNDGASRTSRHPRLAWRPTRRVLRRRNSHGLKLQHAAPALASPAAALPPLRPWQPKIARVLPPRAPS